MILRTEDIKEVCSKILSSVDSSELSLVTETVELSTEDNYLYLAVTNREYYVKVRLNLNEHIDFHATVNATLFLKLIAHTTTDTVELTVNDNVLIVKCNGTYKIPLIFDGDKLLTLPKIEINNVNTSMNISGDVLNSILKYNSGEVGKYLPSMPLVQQLFYLDEYGAITFTTGACVNSFKLEKPIKILLKQKLVKLFKLFKDGNVGFELGHDMLGEILQTKVCFKSDDVVITSILNGDASMVSSVPVDAIRGRATKTFPYSISLNKDEVSQAINRLLLFTSMNGNLKPYGVFEFSNDKVTISDTRKENSESINYDTDIEDECEYSATLDLMDIKSTIDSCVESHIKVNFGDSMSITIARGTVYNVIPEIREV